MWQFLHKLVDLRGKFWPVFLLIAIVLIMIGLLRPRIGSRPRSPEVRCANHLRQLVFAMQYYHGEYGSFPPSIVTDDNDKPMHSWRVLILPYLERDDLYAAYNFDEPWNGPTNQKLAKYIPDIFRCLASEGVEQTSYLTVEGPDAMWRGTESITFDSISDKGLRPIAVVEVANSGIHWMEPRDLDVEQLLVGINPPAGQGISSNHRDGANVAFADGMVRFLRNDTPLETLKAMLTIDGGETISLP